MKKMTIIMVAVLGGMLLFAGCGKEQTNKEKVEDAKDKVTQAAQEAGKDVKEAADDAAKQTQKAADNVAKDLKAATK